MENKPIATGVSLTEHERTIVTGMANEKGLSFSAALRIIIREWEEWVRITNEGRKAPVVDMERTPEIAE